MSIYFEEIFAVVAPGLEDACAGEIAALLGKDVAVEKGGVLFPGSQEDLYRVNLQSRIASRVLVRVGTLRATDFPELHRKVKRLPWGRFVRPDMPVSVRSSSRRSRLVHSDRIAETIAAAINGALGRSVQPSASGPQLIIARFEDDCCRISVDSSGELLHRRGYRTEISAAPLRETLAAGILNLLGWDGNVPLYDPMCGSGTFVIEAAMLAAGIAPGLNRSYAFELWPRFREGLWANIRQQARKGTSAPGVTIAGSDGDAGILAVARRNAGRIGLDGLVRFTHLDIDGVIPPPGCGLVVCNPPYGLRLGGEQDLPSLYRRIGALYGERFRGWRKALFCPSAELVKFTGLPFRQIAALENGGLATGLFECAP